MVVHNRVGIILISSVVFIASTVSIGAVLGVPINQTVTVLSLVGLSVTFSIGAEQILRWTETNHEEDSTMEHTSENTEISDSIAQNASTTDTSSPSHDSLYMSFKEDKEWKEYHDRGYKLERFLSKFANRLGSLFCKVPGVTPRRTWTTIAFVMFLGLAGSVISIGELLVQFGNPQPIVQDVSTTFSIEYIETNPAISMVVLLFITVLPLAYLINKSDMSCTECGAEFSLRSLGRFYNQKERIPITDEEGNETDYYYEYDGYRIIECQECGNQRKDSTRWDNR